MSTTPDSTPPPSPDPTPDPTPEPTSKPAKSPKVKKPGRWRRRVIWTFSVLIVVLFAVRGLLPLALPAVLQKIAATYGLTCSYDNLELNVFSGDAGIWGIKVAPKEGGPAIFQTDYCHGNVSVMNLLKGNLNVWRAEADGVDVNLDRTADGHIPLLDRFVSTTATPAVAPPAPVASGKPQPIDLASPLRLDALRLSHIRVHIHDRGITPEVDTELAMDLRLSNLGSTTSPAKFEMNLSADPILESLKITGEGTSGGKNLDAKIDVLCRGVRLKSAAAYLQPLGITPTGDSITIRAAGNVKTSAALNNAEGFTGSVAFENLSATVDGTEAMALDKLTLTATAIDTKSVHLGKLLIEGGRATAGRAGDGSLRMLGIEYHPPQSAGAPASVPVPQTSAPKPAQAPPAILASMLAEPWSLDEAAVHNASIALHDQGVTPEVNVSFIADELSAKNINHDPQNLNTIVTLTGLLHAPGVIGDIKLSGTAQPFAALKKLHAELAVTGIRPDAAGPYLDLIGVESQLKNGSMTTSLDASAAVSNTGELSAEMKVGKVIYKDEAELLSFNGVSVIGATLAPDTGRIGIKAIEISGPSLSATRNANGTFSAVGFRTKPRQATKTATAAKTVTVTSAKTAVTAAKELPRSAPAKGTTIAGLPRLTLGSFVWKDIHVNLNDQAVQPAVMVGLSDLRFEAGNLTTELDAPGKPPRGYAHARLVADEIARTLDLSAQITPRATGLDVTANLTGTGITLVGLKSYLKPLGIEPTLKDGGLSGHVRLSLDQPTDEKMNVTMIADHFTYHDGPTELTGFDEISVKNAAISAGELAVDSVKITRPRAIASRDAAGNLNAGGIRFVSAPTDASKKIEATAITTPVNSPARPAVTELPPATQPTLEVAAPFVVSVKQFAIEDSAIQWSDAATRTPVNITSGATVHLDNFVFGKAAAPATLSVVARADGAADNCTITGKILTGADSQSAQLDVSGTGLRAGPLAVYFPPGLKSSLKSGRLHTSIDAAVSRNPVGGLAASLKIGASDFRDGPADPPLFRLDSVHLIVPRIDLPDTALAVDEISSAGVETHAEKAVDGSIRLLGLSLGGNAASDQTNPPAVAAAVRVTPATMPAVAAAANPAAPESVADRLAAAHKVLPLVTLEKLDLNLGKLSLTDLSRPDSQPLVVRDLNVRNVNRVEWLGKDAAAKPPTHLQLTCRVDPVIDHVLIDTIVAPFVKHPTLQIDFAATGVRGDGLTGLVPELKPKLDGADLTNGSLTAHFEAEAKLDRRSPLDFDLSHGFDLSFLLNKVYYRQKPDGPVLVGVDEVQAESIRVQPAQSVVRVKELDITKPIGLISQDEAGIHALGWVLKLPKPQPAAPATQPAVVVAKESTNKPIAPPRPAEKPAGEVRIDKLVISGVDAQFNDFAVNPPMMIPLNGLEVEVRNLSTLDPYEDRPIRFSAIVNSGKVKLKERPKAGGGIGGLLGGALAEKSDAPPVRMEDRDLFAQITANGEVSLFPRLHGWAKTSVSGLDLAALEGVATQAGVKLTNGLYDSAVDVKFNPDGSVATESRFILTDLSLSEPSDGPISKALNLPAPLDAAIGAVQGADGSIVFPLKVAVQPDNISYSAVGVAAASGVGQVLVTAIAAAPLKAAGDVGALFGVAGDKKSAQADTVDVPFRAGSIALETGSTRILAGLVEKMQADPSLTATVTHQLGAGDVLRAAERANPSPEQCDALQRRLRTRKVELLNLRADTAGRARAQLMSQGTSGAAPAMQQLAAIDRELAGTEDSLDQVCDLLRPGAEKQAERRTRSVALRIAEVRLAEVKAMLLASGLPEIADRVKVVAPRFNPGQDADGLVLITTVQKK